LSIATKGGLARHSKPNVSSAPALGLYHCTQKKARREACAGQGLGMDPAQRFEREPTQERSKMRACSELAPRSTGCSTRGLSHRAHPADPHHPGSPTSGRALAHPRGSAAGAAQPRPLAGTAPFRTIGTARRGR